VDKTNDHIEADKRLRSDYAEVFSGDAGTRVLNDLMRRCCMFEPTLDVNPSAMAFNDGRRSVLMGIIEMTNEDVSVAWLQRHRSNLQQQDNQQGI
jgi:hypothetical protein